MLGLDAAGKTTILEYYKRGNKMETTPTVGFNQETIEFKGVQFDIFDVGGQDKIRLLWKHYFQNI